jgi:hypothetical protein
LFEEQDCQEVCKNTFGSDYSSRGCDADAEDPCLCEYDIIDGDPAVCTPGDMICMDENTVGICQEDQWSYQEQDCDDFCLENYGEDYYSEGCNSDNPENICTCK